MRYLKVKNWEEFQHYKDRNPPWIKLHRALLDNYEFCALTDAQKAHLILIWIHASQNEGTVPNDSRFLERKLSCTDLDVSVFVKAGFLYELQDASSALAESKQDAPMSVRLEEERRVREEKSNNPNGLFVASNADDHCNCPHQQIIALYHEVLPQCPQVRDWTPARATQLRARWNEDKERQDLGYWRRFFEYVKTCDFLVGKAGKEPFFADLEWMTKAANFTKIREGKYENRRAA